MLKYKLLAVSSNGIWKKATRGKQSRPARTIGSRFLQNKVSVTLFKPQKIKTKENSKCKKMRYDENINKPIKMTMVRDSLSL